MQGLSTDVDNSKPSTSSAGGSTAVGKSSNPSNVSQPTIAVRTVIPNPTKQWIDEEEIIEYDETLVASVFFPRIYYIILTVISDYRRLRKLSQYENAKANIYALAKLLPTATWGQYKPVNDRSKVLCDPATGDPITIWAVGKIAKMWFTKRGIPEKQATLTIVPLSKTLAQQSALLLAKFSNPVLSKLLYLSTFSADIDTGVTQQTSHVIRAIKWKNSKSDDPSSEVNDLYDDTIHVDGVL